MRASEIFALASAGIYFIFILFIILGFHRKRKISGSISDAGGISVLIPFKNEEHHIPDLISSLKKQLHPLAEIIFIDDHSSDNSVSIINKASHPHYPIRLIHLDSQKNGKKAAIEKGIKESKYDNILTTDADCTFPVNWISSHVSQLSDKNPVVTGPVMIAEGYGFWNKFQQIEMISIQSVSIAIGNMGHPISMSGANLSYKKEVFLKHNPYENNHKTLSGDDIYFLQSLKKNAVGIQFLKQKEICVTTEGQNFFGYLRQRIRWMKKGSSFSDSLTILTGLIIFISAWSFIFITGNQLFTQEWNQLLLISGALKIIVDFLLLFLVTLHWKKSELMFWFLPVFLMNVCVIAVLPIIGWWIPVSWKGRKV